MRCVIHFLACKVAHRQHKRMERIWAPSSAVDSYGAIRQACQQRYSSEQGVDEGCLASASGTDNHELENVPCRFPTLVKCEEITSDCVPALGYNIRGRRDYFRVAVQADDLQRWVKSKYFWNVTDPISWKRRKRKF